MKQIEKVTRDGDTQYFRILTKTEMAEILRDVYAGAVENGVYIDEDSSVEWRLRDGREGCLVTEFDAPKRPNVRNIVKFAYYTAGDTQIFGKGIEIVQDDRYGDWGLNF